MDALPQEKEARYPLNRRPVWTFWRIQKSSGGGGGGSNSSSCISSSSGGGGMVVCGSNSSGGGGGGGGNYNNKNKLRNRITKICWLKYNARGI